MALTVSLVSPERKLWTGTAKFVLARTVEGEIGVLAGHEPVLGVLAAGGVVRIDSDTEGKITAAVHGGFLSVDKDVVTILAEVAELADEIDVARAQAALDRARNDESEAAKDAANRAEARLRAVAGLGA